MATRKTRTKRKTGTAKSGATGSTGKKVGRSKAGGRKKAPGRKKVPGRKKAVAKKKVVGRKKAAGKKKAVAKKTAGKKKTTGRKKAPVGRKKSAVLEVAGEETVAKKAPGRKKKATRRAASERPSGEPLVREPPAVGELAPPFSLMAEDGSEVRLADLQGKKIVLYFYPKDNTPGCTIEAQGFRDSYAELASLGAVVFGVSRDSVKTHQGFKEKQELPFSLLSDPDGEVISAYGSWGPKKFMGRSFDGILRQTFLIDSEGYIAKFYPKVTPKVHAAEVLADLPGIK